MTPEEAADRIVASHQKMYEENRDWELENPIYFMCDAQMEPLVMVPMLVPPHVGEQIRDLLAEQSEEMGWDGFLHVSEGWARKASPEEKDITGPVRGHPDAVEVLQIYCGLRDGTRHMQVHEIHRDAPDSHILHLKEKDNFTVGESSHKARWDLWNPWRQEED